jgi:signal transduction histidine kinase
MGREGRPGRDRHRCRDKQEPFDLAALTRQVLAARGSEAEHRNLTLHADLRPARAAGSPRLAERLAANLVDNALRHNIPGGRIDVTTGTRNSRAMLCVANAGTAIPAAAVERIFRPFQRLGTDRTSRGEGTGLGLSIVQAIADAHGADLTGRPQPGGGLLVEVTFPDPGPRTASPVPTAPQIHTQESRPPSDNSAH